MADAPFDDSTMMSTHRVMQAQTQGVQGLFLAAVGFIRLHAPLHSILLRGVNKNILACAPFVPVATEMVGDEARLYELSLEFSVLLNQPGVAANLWDVLNTKSYGEPWDHNGGEKERVFQGIKDDNLRWLPDTPRSLKIASKTKITFGLVCKNVAARMGPTLDGIDATGKLFKDYRVIIYESNSGDGTGEKARNWAQRNPKVKAITEQNVPEKHREHNIAVARNKLLDVLLKPEYDEFEYFVFIDCDFSFGFPSESMPSCLLRDGNWGACCSNGACVCIAGCHYSVTVECLFLGLGVELGFRDLHVLHCS